MPARCTSTSTMPAPTGRNPARTHPSASSSARRRTRPSPATPSKAYRARSSPASTVSPSPTRSASPKSSSRPASALRRADRARRRRRGGHEGELAKVQLSEVLRQIQRAEPVDAGRVYRLLGVRWYGQGLVVRDEKIGADIAADRIYGVKPGDFLYNRLFAWKGSFAVAGAEASGTYVSNE